MTTDDLPTTDPLPTVPADAEAPPLAAATEEPPPTAEPPAAPEEPVAEEPVAEEPVAEEPADEVAEDEAVADEPVADEAEEPVAVAEPPVENKKRWYIVKVQSNREDTIKDAIERRVRIEGLEEYFGQVLVPVERFTEIKNGKRVTRKRKKFPGYIMAEVEYNDKILYLFRETSGVGDFVGASLTREPLPMPDREVQRMLADQSSEVKEGTPIPTIAPVKNPFSRGDKVRVREGIFANLEGEVKEIKEPKEAGENHKLKVELTVFGRPTSVELDILQVDPT